MVCVWRTKVPTGDFATNPTISCCCKSNACSLPMRSPSVNYAAFSAEEGGLMHKKGTGKKLLDPARCVPLNPKHSPKTFFMWAVASGTTVQCESVKLYRLEITITYCLAYFNFWIAALLVALDRGGNFRYHVPSLVHTIQKRREEGPPIHFQSLPTPQIS